MIISNSKKILSHLLISFVILLFIGCTPQSVVKPPTPIPAPQVSRLMLPAGVSVSDSSMEQQCPGMKVIRSSRDTEIVFPPICYGKTIHISMGGILYTYLLSQSSQALIPAQRPKEIAKITLSSDAAIIDWNKCPEIQVFVKGNGKEIHFPKSCFGKGVQIFTGDSMKILDDLVPRRIVKKKRPVTKKRVVKKKRPATKKRVVKKKKPATKKRVVKKKRPAIKKRVVKKKRPVAKKRVVKKKRPVVKKRTKVLPSNMMKVGSWQVEKGIRGKANYNSAASACRNKGMQLPPKSLLMSGKFSVSGFGEWSSNSASTKEAWIVKKGRAKVTIKTNQLVYRCSRRDK